MTSLGGMCENPDDNEMMHSLQEISLAWALQLSSVVQEQPRGRL